ncbi:hypothetical protein HBB16_19775 [Pseudonocardia sp. MCCB 268]|nr:hypothetical protein [Pseudonocardia cytotoxica]
MCITELATAGIQSAGRRARSPLLCRWCRRCWILLLSSWTPGLGRACTPSSTEDRQSRRAGGPAGRDTWGCLPAGHHG